MNHGSVTGGLVNDVIVVMQADVIACCQGNSSFIAHREDYNLTIIFISPD